MNLENEIFKKSKSNYSFTIFFLVFVIILTIGLYGYNYYLSGNISELDKEILQKQKVLAEKKQQHMLKVYNLYTLSKSSINRLNKYSKIRTFINHLEYISGKYNIVFKGFDYKSGELTTTAYTISDNKTIDYQKTVHFLREYKKDKNALFTIKPLKGVNTFENKQKFEITFKIK